MVRRCKPKLPDFLPEFGGLRFPLRIATSTTPDGNGGERTFCGLQMSVTARRAHPVRAQRQAKPAAYNSMGTDVAYAKLGSPDYQCTSCAATMWLEEKIQSSTKTQPRFFQCCKEGQVALPKLHPPPEPLKTLLCSTTPQSVDFRNKIRVYNSIFSFTSFGAQIDDQINKRRGPYTFRISGQNYHRIGSLLPEQGKPPRYAQLYFCDTESEVEKRMGCLNLKQSDVDPEIVKALRDMLDTHSAVARAFRMAREWAHQNQSAEFQLRLIAQRMPQMRQYNLPTVPEVAALIVGDFGQNTAPRDIYVETKNAGPKRISELHPQYMALQYPILFPHGEDSFSEKIPYNTMAATATTQRGYVTMREYYCYHIQQRATEELALLHSGRLFHQYVVDAYTAVEEQRLRWIRFNQKELRADLYNNICDAVHEGDTEAAAIGKRIVLPASFTGSPRYMAQNYQDAMALCRTFGNPSLFITFTANPKWLEMSEMLAPFRWLTSNDRPDLMARVFKLKLSQLMSDLKHKEVFGPLNAAIYTIEFQKRGLPHAHILVWLKDSSMVKTGKAIDEFICVEIPPKETDPLGHQAVTDHMMHGPCGEARKTAPCTKNGQCTKHFPKPFYEQTTIDQEGFPVYRRRNNGITVIKSGQNLHNGFVVPYNRYLLLKYNAHINVEWCNQSRAIKYLFKYINKGPDRATVVVTDSMQGVEFDTAITGGFVDEIKRFMSCRFLAACEAFWRLMSFDIHFSWPAVIRLSFHLSGENTVTLSDTQTLANIVDSPAAKDTMFTSWFDLNITDPEARKYTYAELPCQYVWDSKHKKWHLRKSQKPIGRIVYCHPTAGKKYYLRMLLNVVKGPLCFEDIRTVHGVVYGSYREACYARGMLNDDKEWEDAIMESQLWAAGNQLRELFVTILLFCDVSSPEKLWANTWETLSEDILHQKRREFRFPNLQLTEQQIKTYCLLIIEEHLAKYGKTISEFPGLPIPDPTSLPSMQNRLILEELAHDTRLMAEENKILTSALNDEQKVIYKQVTDDVDQKRGGFYFVYGAGGTGKTFLYRAIMSHVRSRGKIVLAVASSGIAALLLRGGRTAHSRFLIPLDLTEDSTCGITQKSHLAQLLHKVELIIWDEAPMTQRHAFEALNRSLKDIMGSKDAGNRNRLFGGITMLLGGDFRQILPVITKGRRQEIVQATVNNSPLWDDCRVLKLTKNMRVNDTEPHGNTNEEKRRFNLWLRDVGDGIAPAVGLHHEDEATWIEIPSKYIILDSQNAVQQLIDEVFPDFVANMTNLQYLQERAILTPLNDDADQINTHMFSIIKGDVLTYKSSDEVCMASTDVAHQQNLYPTEFLNTLDFPGIPPHLLSLKEGLPVMLLRNVNPAKGLCNGTRLIIKKLGQWVVEAEIITGDSIGDRVLIPRITMTTTQTNWPFKMKRRQFPLKPCFAMTINKSQGQSLAVVGLYLPKPVFSHGQLYVALSRVTNPAGLRILLVNSTGEPYNYTKNVVFKEVFNNLYLNNKSTTYKLKLFLVLARNEDEQVNQWMEMEVQQNKCCGEI